MSGGGVPFDQNRWRALAAIAKADAERLRCALDQAALAKPDGLFDGAWNWDSPAQVIEAFRLAGHRIAATGDNVLAMVDHPLAALLREYRDARKRESTYGEAWLRHVANDGRIYPRWIQIGANSGRMACSAPNLQNIPRVGFEPEEVGWLSAEFILPTNEL